MSNLIRCYVTIALNNERIKVNLLPICHCQFVNVAKNNERIKKELQTQKWDFIVSNLSCLPFDGAKNFLFDDFTQNFHCNSINNAWKIWGQTYQKSVEISFIN